MQKTMTFTQKCAWTALGVLLMAALGTAYAGWVSPGMVQQLADLRLCF